MTVPPPPEGLAEALAGRYALERELGRGGMATVWLARDLRHDRPVAIKVLRPELGAAIGAERFRREIRLTAGLQHPNILPLHDSGEAAGRLWYVMPYVAGETLRAHLARTGPLPVDEALGLVAEIGGALAHAHRHGIVHRDVKPENVLLADGHALVADFGIARAAGGERLTETGLALGTPAYMSPEQVSGDAVDARSDQYALAALAWELLTGEPPYTGPTAQSVAAKHVAQPVPSVRTTRATVPEHVDRALQRALAKLPADRFPEMADFVDALLHPPAHDTVAVSPARRGAGRRGVRALAALAVIVAGAAAGWWLVRGRARPSGLDPDAVVVVPFRVEGADPSLTYLGEGMVDLVAAKLPGGGGLRAVAPRATLAAWRSETRSGDGDPARAVARRLQAGLVLDGSVVGTAGRLTLTGALRDAATGSTAGSGQVTGPADSLPALVDRLVVALLAGRGGVTTQQLAGMTSVPALREYLAGLQAHRAAKYVEALQHFDAALREDSTFALAAMAAIPSAWRGADQPVNRAIAERAFRLRGRLHGADSAMLVGYLGASFPDVRTQVENINDWERITQVAPDRAEAWFELGDRQLHQGLVNDIPNALGRAKQNLQRALALDSSLAIAVDHLLMLALHEGDSAAARTLAPLYERTGSRGDWSGAYQWLLAVATRDTAALARARADVPKMPSPSLDRIVGLALLEGGTIEDAEAASAELLRRAGTEQETRVSEYRARMVAYAGGHPLRAAEAGQRQVAAGSPPALVAYMDALAADLWDGDAATGAAARARLAVLPADTADFRRDAPGFAACAAGIHGIGTEDSAAVRAARRRFDALLPRTPRATTMDGDRRLCASVLDAALAVAAHRPDARLLLARADSIWVYSLTAVWWYYTPVVGRLYDAIGEPREALRVFRRRFVASNDPGEAAGLTTLLREEGRLAASLGDREGAIAAYRRYLDLRLRPDPALVPQRDSVRAALDELLRGPGGDFTRRH